MKLWIFDTINQHHQKYRKSCAPWLAEMLLKLAKAVDADYYEEQDRDQNENVGLGNIKDKTIHGRTFRKFSPTLGGRTLREKIDSELNAGRFLGVFLPLGEECHGFVIAGHVLQEYVVLTKYSEHGKGEGRLTCGFHIKDQDIPQLEAFDVIFYE